MICYPQYDPGVITDERDHFNRIRQHLLLTDEVGMENHLIVQLSE